MVDSIFSSKMFTFQSGLDVRRAKTLQEAKDASSGKSYSNLVRITQNKVGFMTPAAFTDYIQPRVTQEINHDDVWIEIQKSIQSQLDQGIPVENICI